MSGDRTLPRRLATSYSSPGGGRTERIVALQWLPNRGHLAMALAAHLNPSSVGITIERDRFGKPFIPGHPLHFSLSHSGARILLAVADESTGIDIDRTDRTADQLAGLLRYFTAKERAFLADRREHIMQCWTRKEAFAKAVGRGLSIGLDQFGVFDRDPAVALLCGKITKGWEVIDLEIESGYAAAVAGPAGFAIRWAD